MRRCEGLLLSWVRRPCRIHSTTATSTQIRHLVSTLRAPPHLPDTRGNSHDKKTNMGGRAQTQGSKTHHPLNIITRGPHQPTSHQRNLVKGRRRNVHSDTSSPICAGSPTSTPQKTRDIKVCPRDRKAVHIPRLIKYRSLPSNNERTSNYSLSTAISRFGSRNQLQLHGTNRLVHITPPRARFLQTSDHVSIKPAGVPSVASGRQEQLLSHSKYQRHPATAE